MKLPWTNKDQSTVLPLVIRHQLDHEYEFMYEVGVLSDQKNIYLFLEHADLGIRALIFNDGTFKFGAPNDEVLGGHPLTRFGLRAYDFFEVKNSPWIAELRDANAIHPRHNDTLFNNRRHFIATFKDVTFEVVCSGFREELLSVVAMQSILASAIPGWAVPEE